MAVMRHGASAVVAHFDAELLGAVVELYVGVAGVGVFERVGEAFLDYAVGGDVDPAR